MLNELEESPIIGENIEGFISCIESGARGVRGAAPAKDRVSNQTLATAGTAARTRVEKGWQFPSYCIFSLLE